LLRSRLLAKVLALRSHEKNETREPATSSKSDVLIVAQPATQATSLAASQSDVLVVAQPATQATSLAESQSDVLVVVQPATQATSLAASQSDVLVVAQPATQATGLAASQSDVLVVAQPVTQATSLAASLRDVAESVSMTASQAMHSGSTGSGSRSLEGYGTADTDSETSDSESEPEMTSEHNQRSPSQSPARYAPAATGAGSALGTWYTVEEIVAHKFIKKIKHYRIRWQGYSSKHDTWEPATQFWSPGLVEKYELQCLKRTKASKKAGQKRG
jgi:hypothetical protein